MNKKYFSLSDIIDHLTDQAIRADVQMQLQQTQLWTEQTEGTYLLHGESHLKFLGLEELRYSVNLSKRKRFFTILWNLFHETGKGSEYRINRKGAISLNVTISRNGKKEYVHNVEMNGEKITALNETLAI